jgi:nucleoside recognition membrane protein YjiH
MKSYKLIYKLPNNSSTKLINTKNLMVCIKTHNYNFYIIKLLFANYYKFYKNYKLEFEIFVENKQRCTKANK